MATAPIARETQGPAVSPGTSDGGGPPSALKLKILCLFLAPCALQPLARLQLPPGDPWGGEGAPACSRAGKDAHSPGSCHTGGSVHKWIGTTWSKWGCPFSCGHKSLVFVSQGFFPQNVHSSAVGKHLGRGSSTVWVSWSDASFENPQVWSKSSYLQFATASWARDLFSFYFWMKYKKSNVATQKDLPFVSLLLWNSSGLSTESKHFVWWWCPTSDKVQKNFTCLVSLSLPPSLAIAIHLIFRFIYVFCLCLFIHMHSENVSKTHLQTHAFA